MRVAGFDNVQEPKLKTGYPGGRADHGGESAWNPRHVINMSGQQVDTTAYLGRLLVPRRVQGRGGGRIELPQAEPPKTPAAGLDRAPPGKMWISMSALGAPPLDKLNGAIPTVGLGEIGRLWRWSHAEATVVAKFQRKESAPRCK